MITYSKGVEGTSTNEGLTLFEITSTEEEKKTVMFLEYWDAAALHALYLTVWLEREKIVDNIPIEATAMAMPVRVIPLNVEVPVGETLVAKLTPQSSGLQDTIDGAVYYTIE